MKKTKIVCTIGPASESKETLKKLVEAGMNVTRLNFSHGDYEEHGARIKNIREVMAETKKTLAILLDTKGPEIRTMALEGGKDVYLEAGQKFTFTIDQDVIGNKDIVAVTYPGFANDLKAGNTILVDDGLIEMEVDEVTDKEVRCTVKNGGELGGKKGVNLPNVSVGLPALSEKDKSDLKFGCEQGVDFVAASFIRKKEDVQEIRKLLEANGGENIKIISKIENQEGLDNFDGILEASDGIMVARGDLGVEIPIEEVPFAQKMMIEKCNEVGKVVITATQMLDSMIRNPRPTRAEAGDVANAIIDGTDAVMLSGETAKGKYPVESVKTMANICRKTDNEMYYIPMDFDCESNITDAVSKGAVETAEKLGASVIIVATDKGNAPKNVRKYFPTAPIVAACSDEQVARQLMLVKGVYSTMVEKIEDTDDYYKKAEQAAIESGLAEKGDTVVMIAGIPIGKTGTTNMMRVHVID